MDIDLDDEEAFLSSIRTSSPRKTPFRPTTSAASAIFDEADEEFCSILKEISPKAPKFYLTAQTTASPTRKSPSPFNTPTHPASSLQKTPQITPNRLATSPSMTTTSILSRTDQKNEDLEEIIVVGAAVAASSPHPSPFQKPKRIPKTPVKPRPARERRSPTYTFHQRRVIVETLGSTKEEIEEGDDENKVVRRGYNLRSASVGAVSVAGSGETNTKGKGKRWRIPECQMLSSTSESEAGEEEEEDTDLYGDEGVKKKSPPTKVKKKDDGHISRRSLITIRETTAKAKVTKPEGGKRKGGRKIKEKIVLDFGDIFEEVWDEGVF